MLKVQDLNSIIKYFSAEMQNRIQQLQKINRFSKSKNKLKTQLSTMDKQLQNENQEELKIFNNVNQIIQRYENYEPTDLQIQYMKKMVDRVLQIFGFLKWRCRNQSILNHVQRQLISKLNLLISQSPLNIQKIMSFIVDISRKELVSRKIGYSASNQKPPTIIKCMIKNKRATFSRSQTKELKDAVIGQTPTQTHAQVTDIPPRKRTVSGMCNYMNNYIHPTLDLMQKLYSSMNLQKTHMSRYIQSENYMFRDQIKRNRTTIKRLQIYQNRLSQKLQQIKMKSQSISTRKMRPQENSTSQWKEPLMQIKMNTKNSRIMSKVSKFCYQSDSMKAPIMNLSIFARKRCKVKTTCQHKTKQKKTYYNQNNFI